MLDFARLEIRVADDEGFRAHAYQDTVGVWTIGYGSTRINGEPVTETTPAISEPDARRLLRADLYNALITCQAIYENYDQLSPARQEVLANMAYNLGAAGLSRFKRMNEAVRRHDILAWCAEMRASKWWNQVGNRAPRLQAAVRAGQWA